MGLSFAALVVSIWTFSKKQKSEEFRIALNTHNKLEQIVNEAYQAPDSM
jgi:hypothetical protein